MGSCLPVAFAGGNETLLRLVSHPALGSCRPWVLPTDRSAYASVITRLPVSTTLSALTGGPVLVPAVRVSVRAALVRWQVTLAVAMTWF